MPASSTTTLEPPPSTRSGTSAFAGPRPRGADVGVVARVDEPARGAAQAHGGERRERDALGYFHGTGEPQWFRYVVSDVGLRTLGPKVPRG